MEKVKFQDWSMTRGDTMSFNVELPWLEGDLDSLTFTCRSIGTDTILFQKTLTDGCVKIETGRYHVRVAPRDTENASPGLYNMDLQIELNADRHTILQGTLKIVEDQTY